MTLAEFKAWLSGFEAAIVGTPDTEQWAKIKSKLSEVRAAEIAVNREYERPFTKRAWTGVLNRHDIYAASTS